MSSGALTRLAAAPEVAWGTAIVAPAYETLRYLSGGPILTRDVFESQELRGDRQKSAVRLGAHKVAGDIPIEFSYTSYDTVLQALLGGTWTQDVLKAGTTRRSFCLEQTIDDMDVGAKKYLRAVGWEWDKLTLKAPTNGMITGSLSGMGQSLTPNAAEIASSTYAEAETTPPFDAFTGTITDGTNPVALVTEINLSIENGLSPRFVWNSPYTLRPSIGTLKITGQVSAWFDNTTLFEAFIDETEWQLVLSLVDKLGNTLEINLPALTFTSGSHNVSGAGAIPINLDFEAYYESVAESNIVITRTAAV